MIDLKRVTCKYDRNHVQDIFIKHRLQYCLCLYNYYTDIKKRNLMLVILGMGSRDVFI